LKILAKKTRTYGIAMQTPRADLCATRAHRLYDAKRMGRTAPKGRPTSTQGNALGIKERSQSQALKGRPSPSPLQGSGVEIDWASKPRPTAWAEMGRPFGAQRRVAQGARFGPPILMAGGSSSGAGLPRRQQDNPNRCPRLKPNDLRTFPDPRRPTRAGGTKSRGPAG
jgi:hypothetical protein